MVGWWGSVTRCAGTRFPKVPRFHAGPSLDILDVCGGTSLKEAVGLASGPTSLPLSSEVVTGCDIAERISTCISFADSNPPSFWASKFWDKIVVIHKSSDLFMVVVGTHFTCLLIVVEWLKSSHLTAKVYFFCSPNPTSTTCFGQCTHVRSQAPVLLSDFRSPGCSDPLGPCAE